LGCDVSSLLRERRAIARGFKDTMRKFTASVLIVFLLPALLLGADEPTKFKAGAASVAITPQEPMWMAGYAARLRPSEGKAHDLYAKALAIEDADGTRLVMITTDLISIPRPTRDWLEKAAGEKYDLPPEGLLMNCSHTHCGPELKTTEASLIGLDPDRAKQATAYIDRLQQQLLDLVGAAIGDLGPANLSYQHAKAAFAMNRRTPNPAGFKNYPNPEGPVDHDVPVLRVERPDGEIRAVLFGYACHNTTLSFYEFCGDYAGFAQEYLEEAHPDTVAMFMMGCGGDQNPYPRRSLELAQQHGRTLANAVEAALGTEPNPLTGPLRAAYDMATLDYVPPPSREELEALAKSENKFDRVWGERLLHRIETEGKLLETYDCPIQVIQIGDTLTFVALPGETVVDYAVRLKRELEGAAPVWVAGYSNDVFAYIPSRRVLEEGGYEAASAMRYMSTIPQHGPFTATVEERIISKVHELNDGLKTKSQ
jgi:neutral ceramidase